MQHKEGTNEACILQKAELIVWDDYTMSHRHDLETLDRTLKDIRGNQSDLGGVTVRQTLPIIPRDTPADELAACLKSSIFWQYVQRLQLSTNIIVQLYGDADAGLFASKLLNVGNGVVHVDKEGQLMYEDFAQHVPTQEQLINNVYPQVTSNFRDRHWLCERALLAPAKHNRQSHQPTTDAAVTREGTILQITGHCCGTRGSNSVPNGVPQQFKTNRFSTTHYDTQNRLSSDVASKY
jgi:ATP-dependent DNA helicase PIF1